MELRLVTVAFDPETGAFPEAPLAGIEGEIVSVVEHFFHHLDQPHLLLVVHCRGESRSHKRRGARSREDPRSTLGPDERAIYDRLRSWRNGRAEAEGVPSFVLFGNRHLAEIARRRPRTKAELREIRGIGDAKAARYGNDVFRILTSEPSESGASEHEPGARTSDGL